jgi:hypothetical protein
MNANMSISQHRTFETIFRHPMSHNLEWRDLLSMLRVVGEVIEGQNGKLQVTKGGHMLLLHEPRGKDFVSADELMKLRHFLEQTEDGHDHPVAPGTHRLVVLDHREARVYKTDRQGSVAERIVPDDPHGFDRELRNDQNDGDGKRRPERKSFYEAITKAIRGADAILLFGNGTGESSAMEQLLVELRHNHGDVASHVVGSVVVDFNHTTEGQLLAKARQFFDTSPTSSPSLAPDHVKTSNAQV